MTPLIFKAMAEVQCNGPQSCLGKGEALTKYVVKVLGQSVHPPPHCTSIPKGPLLQAFQARPISEPRF